VGAEGNPALMWHHMCMLSENKYPSGNCQFLKNVKIRGRGVESKQGDKVFCGLNRYIVKLSKYKILRAFYMPPHEEIVIWFGTWRLTMTLWHEYIQYVCK